MYYIIYIKHGYFTLLSQGLVMEVPQKLKQNVKIVYNF